MEFLVLGPVEVRRADVAVDLGGARQRSVLARLLIAPGQVVAVDRLIDDIWRGEPAPSALGVLQTYISNLRRILEPDRPPRAQAQVLVTQVPGYALDVQTDVTRFVDHVDAGIEQLAAGDASRSAATLDAALGLWRGDPFADFADEEWVRQEDARLQELRLVAYEHRYAAALSVGNSHATVPALEVLVGQNPLREGLAQLLALALYRTGRQADALQVLRSTRATLREELGLDPSLALRDLETAILEQSAHLGGTDGVVLLAPPPRSPTLDPPEETSNRPAVATLVGRQIELAELRQAADVAASGRMQTVVVSGEPGIGKTWLVEALAARPAATWLASRVGSLPRNFRCPCIVALASDPR